MQTPETETPTGILLKAGLFVAGLVAVVAMLSLV